MFVFIGLLNENSDVSLDILQEGLNHRFSENKVVLQFSRKEELLSARFDI